MDGPPTSADDHVPSADATPLTDHVPGPRPRVGESRSRFAAYLFADIRGYTDFTASRGADAAAELTGRFIAMATATVAEFGGRVGGTWGDEVMAVFGSARDALGAAVLLQERCIAATVEADDGYPLTVGVGLDVGEASAEDGEGAKGGRTLALNVAARLCSRAGAGEVLATRELVHLAGAVPGMVFEERGRATLKGVPGPTPIVRVRPAGQDREQERRFRELTGRPSAARARRRRRSLLAGCVVAALVAALVAVWVARRPPAAPTVPPDSVGAIDPSSGGLVSTVPVGHSPAGVVGFGTSVWVANVADNTVSRVDTRTNAVVDTIRGLAAPVALAVLGPDLWVVNSAAGTVSEVATGSDAVLATVLVGNEPSAIASGFGFLWVTNESDGTLTRIDPGAVARGQPATRTVNVGDRPDGVAAADGAVWVSNRSDDTVSVVNWSSLAVSNPIPVGAGPSGIVAADSGVWVANSLDLTVSRIDPDTQSTTRTVPVGDGPTAVVAAGHSVWVSDSGDATLTQLDASTGQVTRRLLIGSAPEGLAMVGHTLWLGARAYPSRSHRGGTVTVAMQGGTFPSLDPATGYWAALWSAQNLVYDGLVRFNRAPGPAGYELVPDLAQRLPVLDGTATTYTFTLRPGLAYSDGQPVQASDFRRALQREYTTANNPNGHSGAAFYYDAIKGAARCDTNPAPRTCDLSAGIITDDKARTVSFRLARPDPDFLVKLALPWADAAPPGAPSSDSGRHPFPGTGPYLIKAFVPNGPLTLARNPKFHPWSSAAQPAGYPDQIRWIPTASQKIPGTSQVSGGGGAIDAVDSGEVDIAYISPQDLAGQLLAHRERVHETGVGFVSYVGLNTNRGPFRDKRAREALALAIDRSALVRAAGVSGDVTTCRLVPPDFPGSYPGPACPYPQDPLQALRLAASAHVHRTPVRMYIDPDPRWEAEARYLKSVLTGLGFRPTIDHYPPNPLSKFGPVDLYGLNWTPDFPATSQYYDPLVSCASARQPASVNITQYCNPWIDHIVERAKNATDPGQATSLWHQAYRAIDKDVAVIPTDIVPDGVLVSPRVGNYWADLVYGEPALDQMWVR